MPTLADIFTFWVGDRQVFPCYDDLVLDDQEISPVDKQRVLNTPLLFRDEDYDFFASIRQGGGVCGRSEFEVREGGNVRYKGVLAVAFGNFSKRDRAVTFTPQNNDEYACYERIKKDKINILNLNHVPPLRILVGTISDPVVCQVSYQGVPQGLPPNLCLPDAIGWTLTARDALVLRDGEGNYTTSFDRATFQREEFIGPVAPGFGWAEYETGKWARPLFTRTLSDNFSINPEEEIDIQTISQTYDIIGSNQTLLPDNGVAHSEILLNLVTQCGYEVRSNFFNINPDGTAPDNEVYQSDIYQNLVFFQKTDIKNVDASQNATVGEISLEELEEFWALIEVYPAIENNILRVEHISYYNRNGSDFSEYLEPYLQTDASFDGQDIPRRETFSWMDANQDPDFDGQSIEYDAFCAAGDEKPIASDLISTNITDIFDNPQNYVNEGLVVASTYLYQGGNYIYVDFLPISGESRLNAPMAWSYIQDKLYRHNRQLPEGTMNGELVVFEDSIPQAKQEPVTIPLTYDEYFAYNAGKRARTQPGWGQVLQSSYSVKNQILTLQVSHNE